MALNVKFLKGLNSQYNNLTNKDPNAFYYTSDTAQLYLGTIKLSNASDLNAAVSRIVQNENDISDIQQQLQNLVGNGNGSVSDMIDAAINPIKNNIGVLENLDTTAKSNLVEAINELNTQTDNVKNDSKITIKDFSVGVADNIATRYVIMQGGVEIGDINIPKDLVVKSGQVVVNPVGYPAGTYIELTLQNAENDKIYINVETLVDIYKVEPNGTEIQLSINSDREIGAVIKNGAVNADKLAANAVTTEKIANSNVTKAKLSQELQTSIDKANSAVQTVVAGTQKGAISVDGNDIFVTGLGNAAFVNTEDIKEAANKVEAKLDAYISETTPKVEQNKEDIAAIKHPDTGILAEAKKYADNQDALKDKQTLEQAKEYADGLGVNYATAEQGRTADSALQKEHINESTTKGTIAVKDKLVPVYGLKSAAYVDESTFDVAGSAAAAGESAYNRAVEYVDAALTWGSII